MDSFNIINLEEFKSLFKYLLSNNKKLVDNGKNPITVGVEGSAGVGKTTIIQDIANELGMTYVKLSLAQLEDVSEISGFPIKEYKVKVLKVGTKDEWEEKWIAADLLPTYNTMPCGTYEFTNESRMAYAPPTWLPREENPNGVILNLDDYTRANSLFQQAIMELISTGKYVSWSLPKYTTIACTSNPDNGTYNISGSLDAAQASRLVNFKVKFDLDGWGKWAENYNLDSRAINFGLYYGHEIFKSVDDVQQSVNPRSYTTFCNAISGISDWEKPESLAIILNIAKGCFNDKDNVIGHLFTQFIGNKLDRLISPEDLLLKSWNVVKPQIKACVYDGDTYRTDIAAILHTRLLNYAMYYFSKPKAKTEVVQDRLMELINANKEGDKLFNDDLLFDIIKTLISKYPSRTNKFLLNKEIMKKVI